MAKTNNPDVANIQRKKTGDDPDEMGSGPVKSYRVIGEKRPSQTKEGGFFGQRTKDIDLSPDRNTRTIGSKFLDGDWKTPGAHAVGPARKSHDADRAADRNGLKVKHQ